MSSIEAGSTRVLKAFLAGANAQYREAGLGEYQLRLRADGSVHAPDAPPAGQARAGAAAAAAPGASAASGAATGAASSSPAGPADAARAGAAATPAGAAPTLAQVDSPSADSVRLTWQPVPGAARYGIWQDGQLIGSVPNPSFAAQIAANATSVIQIDAELAGGRRSPRTPAVQVSRSGDGRVQARVAESTAAT